jgi:hypothetical protein
MALSRNSAAPPRAVHLYFPCKASGFGCGAGRGGRSHNLEPRPWQLSTTERPQFGKPKRAATCLPLAHQSVPCFMLNDPLLRAAWGSWGSGSLAVGRLRVHLALPVPQFLEPAWPTVEKRRDRPRAALCRCHKRQLFEIAQRTTSTGLTRPTAPVMTRRCGYYVNLDAGGEGVCVRSRCAVPGRAGSSDVVDSRQGLGMYPVCWSFIILFYFPGLQHPSKARHRAGLARTPSAP